MLPLKPARAKRCLNFLLRRRLEREFDLDRPYPTRGGKLKSLNSCVVADPSTTAQQLKYSARCQCDH